MSPFDAVVFGLFVIGFLVVAYLAMKGFFRAVKTDKDDDDGAVL